jgi:hypothetical protein
MVPSWRIPERNPIGQLTDSRELTRAVTVDPFEQRGKKPILEVNHAPNDVANLKSPLWDFDIRRGLKRVLPDPLDCRSGSVAADKYVEVVFEVKDAAAYLHGPGPLPLQCPHCQSLRLMAEVARGITSCHPAIRQDAHPYVLYGVLPIRYLLSRAHQRVG